MPALVGRKPPGISAFLSNQDLGAILVVTRAQGSADIVGADDFAAESISCSLVFLGVVLEVVPELIA